MRLRPDLWVFDLDGVLVDTSPCHARAYEDLWSRLEIDAPPYPDLAGRATRDVVAELTGSLEPSPDRVAEWVGFKQERAARYIDSMAEIFGDTLSSLEALERADVVLALGTSASRANATRTLEHFDLARRFPVIVTADDVSRGKPAPDIYLKAISDSGFDRDGALVVEDAGPGVTAGLEAGARVAVVRSEYEVTHRRFVGRFPDLETLVEQWS